VTLIDLKKEAARAEREKFERAFAWHWQLLTEIPLESQATIVPGRDFRFDFCHRESLVAVELNGGLYRNGGHNRGRALEESYVKLNAAAKAGWCVLVFGTKRLEREMQLIVEEVLAVIRERTWTHG
jgi:very-short-patch-repair endonuclease